MLLGANSPILSSRKLSVPEMLSGPYMLGEFLAAVAGSGVILLVVGQEGEQPPA
jgi:hypothetical protein